MVQRSSTWWRALGVALLCFATTAWPSAARAATTPSFRLVHQDPVAPLTARGTAPLTFSLRLTSPNPQARVQLSLYPRLITRSALTPLWSGQAPVAAPSSTTGALRVTCDPHRVVTEVVTLFTRSPAGARGPCAGRAARLRLPCVAAACDGVYPLRYAVTSAGVTTVEWSLIAVRATRVATPLHVDLIYTLDPSALAHPTRARATLEALKNYPNLPVALTADYRTLERIATLPSVAARPWRRALDAALASPLHRVVVGPPGNVDYGALATIGLAGQVGWQMNLGARLLRILTGRFVDAPVVVSGQPTVNSLAALVKAGAREVVLPEADLATPPSSTLAWGAPFRVTGVPGVVALATDQGLSRLESDAAIEPARRAVLTIDTLALLHFEAPDAPSARTIVLSAPAGEVDPTYVRDLVESLAGDPFANPASLVPSFDTALVATDGSPATRAVAPGVASSWSASNVATLSTLATSLGSFAGAVPNGLQATSLRVALAQSEVVGSAAARQNALNSVSGLLAAQLDRFRVDAGTVTLTGPGTPLPVTISSSEHYAVRVVVHLVTDRLSFPEGAAVPVTLDSPIKSLRVATANHRGSSLTLQVVVTTPDGQLTLARAAIQVRIAGNSIVGYLLTIVSLLVIGVWWWRTARRRTRGRHAR